MNEYEITRSAGRCETCARTIGPEETFCSAVFEITNGFQRRDYCEACWSGPPAAALCHYRTRLPRRTEKRRLLIDDRALIAFFDRLAGTEGDPLKAGFRFVLALVLMRKRLLKYERTEREADREYWVVRLTRDQRDERILNPQLDDQRIALLTGEIGAILSGQTAGGDDENTTVPLTDSVDA